MNTSEKKKKNTNTASVADKRIILSACAMALIPMLVHISIAKNRVFGEEWYSGNETEADVFLVVKAVSIVVIAVLMLGVLCFDLMTAKADEQKSGILKTTKIAGILLAGYGLLVIISSLFAKNMGAAWLGGLAQREPAPVILGYIVIGIFTYCYMKNESTFMFLYRIFLVGAVIIALIGFSQFIKNDFFVSDFGKTIIASFSSITPEQITLKFDEGVVYMTLYNPNYVGSYVALVLPFTAVGVTFSGALQRVICGVISLLLIICLIGSGSAAGIAGVVAAVFVFAVFLIKKRTIRLAVAGAACAVVIAGVFVAQHFLPNDDFPITQMNLSDDVQITYKGSDMKFRLVNDEVTGELSDGSLITLPYDELNSEVAMYGEHEGFKLMCRNITLDFVEKSDGYYFYNVYGNVTRDVVNSKKVLFKNHDRFASGRGFIWSRTIPMLPKYMFLGCGQDNFIYAFPNNDYLSLLNNEYSGQVITRPHNMFLQTGVQSGVISLILFFAVFVLYFIQGIKIYAGKRSSDRMYMPGLAILAGITGYMVTGLANDQSVCVAPVFWVLLGTGFGINKLLKVRR